MMTGWMHLARVCVLLGLLQLMPSSLHGAWADTGITEKTIRLGQTAPIDGPAKRLGAGMRDGLLAAFKEINDQGGIGGRKLELVTMDDGYEPERAIQNTHILIDQEKVFAVAGGVGTPTSQVIESILSPRKIPYIGPFSGAEILRHPYKRYVVNIRPSYFQEAEEMIRYLVDHKRYDRIGILYQDDSFGRAGLDGIVRALKKRNLQLVSEETYKRNTVAVKRAVLEIKGADADAVVLVGTYQPLSTYIRLCRELGLKSEFIALSFVGSEALEDELGKEGEGVLITQVVPFPRDTSLKIVASYKKAIQAFNPASSPGYTSFEGYIVGRLIGKTLSAISPAVTREGFIDYIVSQKEITIDDLTLIYGPEDNQGLDQVYPTLIGKDGKVRPYSYSEGEHDGRHKNR